MAQKEFVYQGKTYHWDGARWYDAKTFIKPTQAIINELETLRLASIIPSPEKTSTRSVARRPSTGSQRKPKRLIRTPVMELILLERIKHLGGMATTEDLHEIFKLQADVQQGWQSRSEENWFKGLRFALIYMADTDRGWLSRPFGQLGQEDEDAEGRAAWIEAHRPDQSISNVWKLEKAGEHYIRKLRQSGMTTPFEGDSRLISPYDADAKLAELRQKILEKAEELKLRKKKI